MPIGHISLPTGPSQFEAMRAFYLALLEPLGYVVYKEQVPKYCGMGTRTGGPDLWLHCGAQDIKPFDGDLETRDGKVHVAFNVGSRGAVDKWHKNALKAGGVCNGKPGERPHYVKGYYSAYVIDPLGNNLEAVYWQPWWLQLILSAPYLLAVLFGAALAMGYAKYYA